MKNILEFWALNNSKPRDAQLKVFDWLEKQDKKYIILESPVGSGKSVIAMTYSGFLNQGRGSSYVLTPQRILQEQYEYSFRKELLFSLYGKSNYNCDNKNTNCSVGSKINPLCDSCPHKNAVQSSIKSPNLVLNYKLALLHFAYIPLLGKRELMILDECHSLEKELIEFDTVNITKYNCKKYNIDFKTQNNIDDAFNWIKNYYYDKIINIYIEFNDEILNLIDNKHLNPHEISLLKDLEFLERHIFSLKKIYELDINKIKEEYVLVNDNKTFFNFKKLYAKEQFNKILKPKADKFLFMSATIIDHKSYCNDLGINIDECSFLSIESEFLSKNRPVYFAPVIKMNAKWKDEENIKKRKDLIEDILSILKSHTNDSGIIHSGNFEVAKWLIKELNGKISHKIFHHIPSDNNDDNDNDLQSDENVDRNDSINNFIEYNKPALLISPSITEGLDLKNDLSRFAIFAKIPFGYLGDQWIKARMDKSKEWYQRMALIHVLQGCGRIVRNKEDYGTVYILDKSWEYLFNTNISKIPSWWLDAYIDLDD